MIVIASLVFLLIGYAMGRDALNKQNIDAIGKKVRDTLHPTRLGAIQRPTAGQVNRRLDPIRKETEEAMREALAKMDKIT